MPKVHTVVDNFNDNAENTVVWTYNPADQVREVNRRVEMRPRSNEAATIGASSDAHYDFTDSEFRIELVQALDAPGARTGIGLATQAFTGHLLLWVQDGELLALQNVSGTFTTLERVQYDAVQHRWLRLRERLGRTFWEASPDGSEWTTLHSRGNPLPIDQMQLQFGVQLSLAVPSPGVAVFDNVNVRDSGRSLRVDERRLAIKHLRIAAAELAASRPHEEHANNNDETNYPSRPLAGSYSKSLMHDALGDPDPSSYATLLRALQSRDPADFEEIQLAPNTFPKPIVRLTNPQAGLTIEIEGPDPQEFTMPPAPRFDSEVTAHEAGELYWMAAARDVPFVSYGTDTIIGDAVGSLNGEFPQFGGTAPVTRENVFRGIYPGEQVGPYVSQFLWKGNVDRRKPVGLGRNAADGYISYGARSIDQRQIVPVAGIDYLLTFADWLSVQNGEDRRGMEEPMGAPFDGTPRFIRNLRDGATFVHFDQVLDAFYNAAWLLMSEPDGDQLTVITDGVMRRPQIDLEFPFDQGNPYDPPGMTSADSRTQVGFASFGQIHLLQVLGKVVGRALRAVWWQKWGVHRRLRPEEYGGRVDNHLQNRRTYDIHGSILASLQTGGLAPYYGQTGEPFPSSYLLPQAYPEGCPTHPSYGAGHATGAAACATILKAFFDDTKAIENPLQANDLGTALVPYTGADATQMTVGSELNKLAGNIAIFRNAAGVHWRSDYTDSLRLGEAVAIALLQEMTLGFQEDDAFFELNRLDGTRIRIFDGTVVQADLVAA